MLLAILLTEIWPKNIDRVPWYDQELVDKRVNCCHLFETYRRIQSPESLLTFREARADYQSSNRKKMINYYLSKTSKDFKSSRKFWEFYSRSIQLKKSNSSRQAVKTIVDQSVTHTDPGIIAAKFNKFFTNLGGENKITMQEAKNFVLNSFSKFKRSLPSCSTGSFNFSETTADIILKYLSKLEEKSSPGISGIPVKLLKACAPLLSNFLCELFNDCVQSKCFPNEFKFAVVTPLFKNKGEATDMNNYRGISVLPPICKVFEKILAEQIRIYFSTNKLFFSGQHGFREFHSCESALHEIVSTCLKNIDKNQINLLLFIDFKKAFDLVSPELLLVKLMNYGFSNDAVHLMNDYFDFRAQSVRVSNVNSLPLDIKLGVPQGSVLGPLLFLIYINDLPQYLNDIRTKLFADDTTLIFANEQIESSISACKNGLRLLIEWCDHNYLYVNWSKTFAMIVSNKRLDIPSYIECNGFKIEVVSKFKLLGVVLDQKLSFLDHVCAVGKAINSKLFAIKKLFYLSLIVKIQFFKTFILPYFDYCLSLIFYFSKTAISKLARIYYRCIYKLFKIKLTGDVKNVNKSLKAYNLFSFEYRILYKLSTFSFMLKSQPNAPVELRNFLQPAESSSRYSMRASTQSIVVKPGTARTSYGQCSFDNFYADFYNKIKVNRELFLINDFINFKKMLLLNLDIIFSDFIKHFSQFDLNTNYAHICF